MARYRICGGLSVMPGRDMAMLKDMSAKGWHVSGMSGGILYRFEQGEPRDYDYAVDFQREFTPEVQEMFRAGGWQSVVSSPGWQILRAKAGTTPLYTTAESQAATLQRCCASTGWSALAFGIAMALCLMLEARFSERGPELAAAVLLVLSVAFGAGFALSFVPFLGYARSLRRIRCKR